jgi:hypothetical protein
MLRAIASAPESRAHTRGVNARRCLVIAFLVAGLLLSARPALACSCHSYTPTELAAASEVIFTGTARAYVGETIEGTLVEFQVATAYKGALGTRVQVQALGGRGPSELGAGCGWGFHLGRQYTVFAVDGDKDGVPNTNGCFQNVKGPISAATYGLPPGQGDGDAVLLAIVAAVALAALAAMSMLHRARHTV